MLLTMIAALAVGASNAPPVATLAWHEAQKGDALMSRTGTAFYGLYQDGQSLPGYKAPAGLKNPRFFTIYRSTGESLTGVVGRSKAGGPIDEAWVDWNNDKVFEPSEMGKLYTGGPQLQIGSKCSTFEFAKLPKGPYGPIHARLAVVDDQMVSFVPTGYMLGSVELDGKPAKVALFDLNCDGVYGGDTKNGIQDGMALDVTGTGRFDGVGVQQILALMQLADGKFWEPVVSPNGTQLKFVENTSPTGTIAFNGGEMTGLFLSTDKGLVSVVNTGGKVTVPAGAYILNNAQFTIKDDAGERWQCMVSRYNAPKINVSAGATTTVACGGPLKLQLAAQRNGPGYMFSLSATDAGGSSVSGVYDTKGKQPQAPQVSIVGPDGNVVKTLPLSYG